MFWLIKKRSHVHDGGAANDKFEIVLSINDQR